MLCGQRPSMAPIKLMVMIMMLVPVTAGRCPSGFSFWYQHGQGISHPYKPSCYKFVRTDMAWLEARRNCKKLGGDLVSIETAGENNHLIWIIKRHWYLQKSSQVDNRYWGYWTGGNDLHREGDWRWASTNVKLSYTNWWPGQPNNEKRAHDMNENCLDLCRNLNWRWADWSCYSQFMGSVCEIKVVKA